MGEYRRRASTTPPEVVEALRTSPELAELRRAARELRLSLRRQRYGVQGRLVWQLRERGPEGRLYGWVELHRTGVPLTGELFDQEVHSVVAAAYTGVMRAGVAAARAGWFVELHTTGPIEVQLLAPVEAPALLADALLPEEELLAPVHVLQPHERLEPQHGLATAWLALLLAVVLTVAGLALGAAGTLWWPLALAGAAVLACGLRGMVAAVHWGDRLHEERLLA